MIQIVKELVIYIDKFNLEKKLRKIETYYVDENYFE